MIQWNAAELDRLMRREGLANVNRLREFAGLTIPTAYKISSGEALQRIDVATLESLASAFGVHPLTLLEWTPDD